MAAESEGWVQLATRLPKSLHYKVRLHCLKADTTMMHFLVAALREKLVKASGGERRRANVDEEHPHRRFRTRPGAPTLRTRRNKTAVPKRGQRYRGRCA
jgi:hypothetical protein